MMKTALIVGATGLVGKACLYGLLETKEYTKIIALVRKPLAIKHHQLEQIVVDFNQLASYATQMVADDVYCCLGTTIKVAGSQEKFRLVDYVYPLEIAKICHTNGAKQYLLVSALGANAQSSIFYSKVKGELEQAIEALKYSSFIVFQPSLLLGNRSEIRIGEMVGQAIMKVIGILFIGPLKLYKAIPGATVAKAMIQAALKNKQGKWVIKNDEIFEVAKG